VTSSNDPTDFVMLRKIPGKYVGDVRVVGCNVKTSTNAEINRNNESQPIDCWASPIETPDCITALRNRQLIEKRLHGKCPKTVL
jgi:hypothetical protein